MKDKKKLVNLADLAKQRASIFSHAVYPFYHISGWGWMEKGIPTSIEIENAIIELIETWEKCLYKIPYRIGSGGIYVDVQKEDDLIKLDIGFCLEESVYMDIT